MIKKYQIFRALSVRVFCCVLLGSAVAGTWLFSRDGAFFGRGSTEELCAEGGMALFDQAVRPHDFSRGVDVELPEQTRLASLGSGLSWMQEFWEGGGVSSGEDAEAAPRYDDSLSAFLSAREGMCIPNYSEAVPREKDSRYVVEDSGCDTEMFRSVVRSGDSAGALFARWLDNNEIDQAVKAASSVYSMTRIMPGHLFSVERDKKTELVSRLFYDIDDESRLVIERTEDGFSARVDVFEFDTKLVKVSGTIHSSLFEAMADAGESANLAVRLADVFSHQINFVNEVQEGDTFEMVVEKKYLGDEFRRYGDIVAARFVNDGETFEAFRFVDAGGKVHYFAADGSSLETEFLKAPLNFTRVSSVYTMHRKHPIFGKVRPHQGVDYAAPRGTPVKALGAGKVVFRGWKNGYGNTLVIRHSGGIETQYAHLSRFASSLKVGQKVGQGEVVAFVGATGTATGPHLDFRVMKNGRFVNPDTLSGTRSAPVSKADRARFGQTVASARSLLDSDIAVAEK